MVEFITHLPMASMKLIIVDQFDVEDIDYSK